MVNTEQHSQLCTYDKHQKRIFHNLNISTVNKEKYKRSSSKEEEERHTRETKGRIFRCVQRDTIRDIEHCYV